MQLKLDTMQLTNYRFAILLLLFLLGPKISYQTTNELLKDDLSDESESYGFNAVQKPVGSQFVRSKRRLMQEQLNNTNYQETIRIYTPECNPQTQDCSLPSESVIECDDEAPPDATFGCEAYADIGACQTLDEQYCKKSCERCGYVSEEAVCTDSPLPGTDCSSIVSSGICNADQIRGIFCNKSCGYCGSQTPPLIYSPQPIGDCSLQESLECDVDALMQLKGALTGGQELLSSWQGSDPCKDRWKYISCQKTNNRRVSEISLDFYQTVNEDVMTGRLVPQISNLRFLESFTINSAKFTGELLPEFSVLTNLRNFEVIRTDITGILLPDFSTWEKLEDFTVSYNSFNGKIPVQYSNWKNLQEFIVSTNRLSGNLFPEFSAFSKLDTFDVGVNFLTGTIPAEYSNFQNCKTFTIAQNIISGTLPLEFSVWKNLDYLYISDNRLTGPLPETYSQWNRQNTFLVQDNKFSGILPVSYSEMIRIERFDVSDNNLSGNLPIQYSVMKRLELFSSSGNNIESFVPNEWSQLEKFAQILV